MIESLGIEDDGVQVLRLKKLCNGLKAPFRIEGYYIVSRVCCFNMNGLRREFWNIIFFLKFRTQNTAFRTYQHEVSVVFGNSTRKIIGK